MRSKEYVGTLILVTMILMLKICSIVALCKARPRVSAYHRARLTAEHQSSEK